MMADSENENENALTRSLSEEMARVREREQERTKERTRLAFEMTLPLVLFSSLLAACLLYFSRSCRLTLADPLAYDCCFLLGNRVTREREPEPEPVD